jgi:hypothetical protein
MRFQRANWREIRRRSSLDSEFVVWITKIRGIPCHTYPVTIMSLFATSKPGLYWTLGPKAPSGVPMRSASSGGLTKTACSRPLDDKAPAATRTGPHVLSCLPWSVDDAQNGGLDPEYTLPSGVLAHDAPPQGPSNVTCVLQEESGLCGCRSDPNLLILVLSRAVRQVFHICRAHCDRGGRFSAAFVCKTDRTFFCKRVPFGSSESNFAHVGELENFLLSSSDVQHARYEHSIVVASVYKRLHLTRP